MRNIMKKIIVSLFLALLLINNSLLLLVANALDEVQNIIDMSKVKALTEVNLEKYVNYTLDDNNRGLMLQLDLKSGIEYGDGQEYIPIGTTGISLMFPKIKEEFPQKVEIVGVSTKATNGGEEAKDWQYNYNNETGELRVASINKNDDNGSIYSKKVENARDEYKVIAYYSENCYSESVDKSNIKFGGEIHISLADDSAMQITDKIEKDFDVDGNISGVISEDVSTDEVFKGYINSNSKNGTNYETVFNEISKLNMYYKEISDELYFSNSTQFTYKDGSSVDTSDVVYKSTKINKNEVLEVLGQEGKLEVLDKQGNVLLDINKDTKAAEDGIVEVNYENEVTGVTIKTTKPINVGIITVNNTKAIKSTMVDRNVNGMKTSVEISCKSEIVTEQEVEQQSGQESGQEANQQNEKVKEQKEVYQFKDEHFVELKEPETKIEARIDNTDWLTYINNSVNFNLTLLSNQARYDLFENPIIEIKLPEQVEKVVLGDVHPLYGGNLSIKAAVVLDRGNAKVIRIELDGAQNEYFTNSMIEGINVVVPVTIVMKKDVSEAQANVELTYENKNATSIDYINEGKALKECSVNIVTGTVASEPEMVSESKDNKGSMSLSGKMQTSEGAQESGESEITGEAQQNIISADIKATVGKKELKDNDEVYEDQIIKYTIKLKNNTDKKVENINIVGNIPEGTHYATVDYGTDYKTTHDTYDLYKYVIDEEKTEWNSNNISLESGEEAELYYEVKVSKLPENETEKAIKSDIKVKVENSNILQYSLNNIIKKAEISVELKSTVSDGEDNSIVYNVYIFNNLDIDIKNVKVEVELPKELKYVEEPDEFVGTTFKEENNKVEINIDSIKADSVLGNSIFASLRDINDNTTQYEPKVEAIVSADNINNVYHSNENRITLYTSGIEIKQTSEREGEDVNYDEEIEYDIVIKNTSNEKYEKKAYNINVKDYINENLEFSRIEYEYFEENSEGVYEKKSSTDEMEVIDNGENEDNKNEVLNLETVLPIGETIKIKLVLKVGAVFDRTEISNKVDVIYGNKTKSSNVIKNNILPFSASDGVDDPDASDPNDGNKERHNISGIAWIDENRDGQMNTDEKKFPNITVKLFNADTGSIVKDDKGNNMQITTDENGKYQFENIGKGKYLVIFIYDNSKYTTTTYKQSGVNESANSNVIEKEASIDNNELIVAASDIIEINSADIENINIGLVEKVKFDLSLDKTITKVYTTYNGKTNEKEYKATKLAKVEIPAKQISNIKLVVEYQIEVKNEGNIDAYVDEIIDYIPKGLEFDIEINSDWIETSDRNIKNTSLAGKKIAPGESQMVKLELIKSSRGDLTGTIKNGAEILKASNLSGVSDIDSVEGNKNASEDDYSEAELIVSIKTGAITYTLSILGIIIILIVLKILVDKKIINIKSFKVLVLFAIVVGLISCVDYSRAYVPKATTEAGIKQELANAYKGVTVHLRYGVGYVHHGSYHSIGQLYCSDGNSMCSQEDHVYTYRGIEKYNKTTTETLKPIGFEKVKLAKSDSAATVRDLNSGNNIAGPFKVGYDEDKVKIKVISVIADGKTLERNDDYVITNKAGTEKIQIKPRTPFYIKIRKTNVNRVTIKITGTGSDYHTESKYKITYREVWRCVGTCNYSSLHKPQVMWKDMQLEGGETTDKPNEKTVTLVAGRMDMGAIPWDPNPNPNPNPDPETGALVLQKVDDRDTDIPLEKVGFIFSTQVETYDWVGSYDHYHWVTRWGIVITGITDKGLPIISSYPYQSWEYWWTENFYQWRTHTMYLNSNYQWTESRSSAKTFYTDADGMISVGSVKLPNDTYVVNEGAQGNNYSQPQRYVNTDVLAIEVSNEKYGYSPEIGKSYTITRHEAGYMEEPKVLENHQKYIKLSGYVWVDKNDGKDTVRNDLYDTGNEKGLDGIQVYLKDSNGNIIKTTQTSRLGLYSEIDKGEYQFTEVDVDELEKGRYHIEFEYNGLIYKSVDSMLDEETGSKAEDTNSRNTLNSAFGTVNGNGTQTLNIGQGIKVNYYNIDSENHRSNFAGSANTNVFASTDETGYDLSEEFEPTLEEIRYINFGVYEKAQTDYALTKDLYNVRVEVNGYSHIYRYATSRYSNFGDEVNEETSWNVGVKFQNNRGTYTRAIYKSDLAYTSPNHRDNELRVYATYKIALRNESTYLGRINSLVDYCDNRFDLIAVGSVLYEEIDQVASNVGFSSKEAYNNEYSKYVINTNMEMDPGSVQFLYAQFELKREAVLNLINAGEVLNNVIEINSYTTFENYDPSSPIAVIDTDSVPGNAIPGQVNTYEDDTDSAPSLKLELKNERSVYGRVFEDSTGKDSNVYIGEERIGDGLYEKGKDKVLSGIKVTLEEIGKEDSSYDDERIVMETTTDDEGNFKFNGFIPGNYIIKYTWGDKEYKVQYYKGTVYDEARKQDNPYWYRGSEYGDDTVSIDSTKNDALDSREIRRKIDGEMEALKNNTLEDEINKAYDGGSEYIKTTTMDSSTPTMGISVEYTTTITDGMKDQVEFIIKNVDFGIVQRPLQKLEFSKRISAYKLTLVNGQVLVDAIVTEDGKLQGVQNNTSYMGPTENASGIIRTEMDNELIEGATLEVTYTMKVTNIGELDYVSDRYYYYGNSEGSDKVRVSVAELLDYVDGRLAVVDDKWNEQEREYLKEVNAKQKDNKTYLNFIRTYMTEHLGKPLAPTESHTVDLHTSKLLANTDDNTYNNEAEITILEKNEGFSSSTPVKAVWNEEGETPKFNFNSDSAEIVTIIPNTGEDRSYIVPIIIGITVLVMLASGLIAIKKFVIDQ